MPRPLRHFPHMKSLILRYFHPINIGLLLKFRLLNEEFCVGSFRLSRLKPLAVFNLIFDGLIEGFVYVGVGVEVEHGDGGVLVQIV